MKERPCGSMFGSVRPSLKPLVSIRVNRSFSGSLPLTMALNWLAYLLSELYATTIWVPAYWTYHLVNLGSSGAMLSPPTLSKTFGLISLAAMSDDKAPEELTQSVYLSPVALMKAGTKILELK